MEIQKPSVTEFIASYARHSAARDFPALFEQFAKTFLVAGPGGAQCVRADDFARVLPRRVELFESMGCQSAELIETQETWLDARYAIARTTWRFTFRRADEAMEIIDSESIFMIDAGCEPYRILLYLTPRDIMETIRLRGITA